MSKKTIWTIVVAVAIVAVGVVILLLNTEKNVEGTLEEIMTKLYAGIPAENLPMMLGNVELNSENVAYYLGTSEVEYKEALASESMVGAIAHSVSLVRVENAREAKKVVAKIKENADPRKWICVEASNVVVKSKGDLVILIMSDTEATPAEQHLAPKLEANFDNL